MKSTFLKSIDLRRASASAQLRIQLQRGFVPVFLIVALSIGMYCPQVTAQTSTAQRPFDAAAVNSSQVVVLSTGGVLKGKVSFRPGAVVVETDSGSRPVLPQNRVDFVCNSMPEAYWEKLARLKASDVLGQMSLFDFCLKHKLLDEAENQINLLANAQYNLKAEVISKMQRRLIAALEQESTRIRIAQAGELVQPSFGDDKLNAREQPNNERSRQPIASVFPSMANAPLRPQSSLESSAVRAIDADGNVIEFSNRSVVENKVLNPQPIQQMGDDENDSKWFRDTQVQPVGYSAPVVLEATYKEIMDELRRLPAGSVASFRRQVEPLLVAGCVQCHDKASGKPFNGFPLIRGAGKSTPDRYSQRNLFAILGLIDRSGKPEESYLWTIATQAHASNNEPIYPVETEEAERLLAWLAAFTNQDADSDLVPEEAFSSDANASNVKGETFDPVQPVQAAPDLATMPSTDRALNSGLSTIGDIPSLGGGGLRVKGYVQIDPFDPEIFNRRIAAKKTQQKPASSAKQ